MDNGKVVFQKRGVPLPVLGRLMDITRAPPVFCLYGVFVCYLRRK